MLSHKKEKYRGVYGTECKETINVYSMLQHDSKLKIDVPNKVKKARKSADFRNIRTVRHSQSGLVSFLQGFFTNQPKTVPLICFTFDVVKEVILDGHL